MRLSWSRTGQTTPTPRTGIRTRRMTYSSATVQEFTLRHRRRASRGLVPKVCTGAAALAFSITVGTWILEVRPAVLLKVETTATGPTRARAVAASYGALLDPALTGIQPVALANIAPLGAALAMVIPPPSGSMPDPAIVVPPPAQTVPDEVADVPLPTPRPPEFRSQAGLAPARIASFKNAQASRAAPLAAAPTDNRTFFEKLFGINSTPGPTLAYAAPEDSVFGGARNSPATPGPYDHYTAIYDIAAHTVYMPNGDKLEAHSGLGEKLDDPRHVNVRSRGATPPHIYELQPRAQLFHGVQALRLNPVGSGSVFGRTGLLAHSYMLGPNGDSNGCVSFRNYDAFLRAYSSGEVKRLAVVARMI